MRACRASRTPRYSHWTVLHVFKSWEFSVQMFPTPQGNGICLGFCLRSIFPEVCCVAGVHATYTRAQGAVVNKGLLTEHGCVAVGRCVPHMHVGALQGRMEAKVGRGERGPGASFPCPIMCQPRFLSMFNTAWSSDHYEGVCVEVG